MAQAPKLGRRTMEMNGGSPRHASLASLASPYLRTCSAGQAGTIQQDTKEYLNQRGT